LYRLYTLVIFFGKGGEEGTIKITRPIPLLVWMAEGENTKWPPPLLVWGGRNCSRVEY